MQNVLGSAVRAATEVILVVEDEPELASILERALSRHGYTVLTAGNGTEALEVAAAYGGSIDLLISDVVMPRMGGRELVWRFRQKHPHMKVILCSGYTDIGGAFQMIENEVETAFLEKPVDLADLVETVRHVLDLPS